MERDENSIDKNSIDSDTDSVISDAEDEKVDDLINEIHHSLLDLINLRDHYWKTLEDVKSLIAEELRKVLEIAILEDWYRGDPEQGPAIAAFLDWLSNPQKSWLMTN